MKKLILIFSVTIIIIITLLSASAVSYISALKNDISMIGARMYIGIEADPVVYVNGRKVAFSYRDSVSKADCLTAQIVGVSEALGARIDRYGEARTSVITRGEKQIRFSSGKNAVNVNGSLLPTRIPAQRMNDYAFALVKAIAGPLGSRVDCDTVSDTVIVNDLYEANKDDISALERLLGDLFTDMDYAGYYRYYAFSDDSVKKAVNIVLDNVYPCVYHGIYGRDDLEIKENDPLGYFGELGFYVSIPAYKAEWIMMNVFNIVPERKTYRSTQYYYNNNYYVNCKPRGVDSRTVKTRSIQRVGNVYIIDCSSYYRELGEEELIYLATYRVTAGLKIIDGLRVWSFFEINDVDNMNTSEPTSGYDYEDQEQRIGQQVDPTDHAAMKNEYLRRANEINRYSSYHLADAYKMYELKDESVNIYYKWDALLNDVYQYLKTILPADKFDQLREDEREWIKEKEAAVQKTLDDVAGAWSTSLIMWEYSTAAQYTEDRCYYLISLIE